MSNEEKAERAKEWGVLPDAAVLRRLRNSGMTYAQIAELYGVTESGVWRAFDRAGLIVQRPTYRDVVPWVVDRKFSPTQVMQHLRTMARMQAKLPVSEADRLALERWLARMRESGVVLAYHPEAPPNEASQTGGFYYAERAEEDGDDFFRS